VQPFGGAEVQHRLKLERVSRRLNVHVSHALVPRDPQDAHAGVE
jgi:hypothetical protein